jgi:TolB-like protein/Flp pilus assembly protein TadD
MSLFAELKRRNVFRVGIAYAVTSWLLIQVSDILLESIGTPPWVMQTIFVVLAVGFVITLFFAWAFELTPEGVKREKDVDRSDSIAPRTGQKLNLGIVALLLITLAYVAYDKLVLDDLLETGPVATAELPATRAEVPPDPEEVTEISEPADTQKSIVVLPFVNMSSDPDQEYFSDGLSEELLNVLAQVKDLRVISRTSAFAFKGKDMDIPTIAAQLGVSHVLEGSVRKAGNDVRITAQLIEVATDSHLWSEAYNRNLENIFEIQEEISKAIAAELQVTLGTSANTGNPTDNLEAWQLFLRGRNLYQNRGEAQLERSVSLLKQAVALDPGFAEAWANLAAASIVYGYGRDDDFEVYYRDGRQAALRAIEIDPNNGFAHAVLGLVNVGNLAWEDAMRELDRAIELNPNETNSLLWKGIALNGLGYVDQALAILLQAEQLDPVFTNLQNWLAITYENKGDFESARRCEQKILRLDPDFEQNDLGTYELYSGNLDAAEQIARASEMKRTGSDLLAVALYSALRDPSRQDESLKILLENEDSADTTDELITYLWRLGETTKTLGKFRQLSNQGRGLHAANSLGILWNAYDRAGLSDPALPAFFEEMGMADYWRKHGNPDYCRVGAASIVCGDQ